MTKFASFIVSYFLITIITVSCFGQYQFDRTNISSKTSQIVAQIEAINELMGSAVYYAGSRPPQFNYFITLRQTASKNELAELTNHSNGVVRSYAFWALAYDTSVNLLPILIHHINDTTRVQTQFGCIGGGELVGDFMIDVVKPNLIDLAVKKLTPLEHAYLDSILIYTPNSLNAKNYAIDSAQLTEHFYERVKELFIKEGNQSALLAIARFRRENDIPLILNNKKAFYTYKAISQFPDSAFLPFLKQSLDKISIEKSWGTEWRELYKAIASFKNEEAHQLLKMPFIQAINENMRGYHMDFILEAVQEFYTPIYDDLLWKMWENEKKINTEIFFLLYSKDPVKAFQLTQKTLQNVNDFYYLSTGYFNNRYKKPVDLLDVMLDSVLAHDRPFAIKIITETIREINVHSFPTFANKVSQLKDSTFTPSLFYRLETDSNPHIFLKATEVLISFKSKSINKRIAEAPKRNSNLRKNWGGEAFSKMLKENGIYR